MPVPCLVTPKKKSKVGRICPKPDCMCLLLERCGVRDNTDGKRTSGNQAGLAYVHARKTKSKGGRVAQIAPVLTIILKTC